MMIDPTLTSASYAALENAINRSLTLDHSTRKKLADYAGRVLCISCHQPDITMYIRIGEKIEILQHYEHAADASIEGKLAAWLELLAADDTASALINGELSISGDSTVFVELKAIAANIQLDWEGHLSRIIGDVPAHFAGRATDLAISFGKQLGKTLHRSINDFLHEEARLLPTRIEVENFSTRLREIEMQLDRMQARLSRHQQQNADKDKNPQ